MQIEKKREKQRDKTKIKYDIILGYLYQKTIGFGKLSVNNL